MKYLIHEIYKRLIIHWQTTLLSLGTCIGLTLWALGKIDATELSVGTAAILTVYAAISKDSNKIPTKQKFQSKDPE